MCVSMHTLYTHSSAWQRFGCEVVSSCASAGSLVAVPYQPRGEATFTRLQRGLPLLLVLPWTALSRSPSATFVQRSLMPAKKRAPDGKVEEAAPKKAKATEEENEGEQRYFLMKSEPHVFGVDALAACSDSTHCWDGVRNYQARNFMQKDMRVGDLAFFYHSNCKIPGIVGVMKVVRTAYPDHTQFDPKDEGYDAKSTKEKPRWFMVDVQLQHKLPSIIPLTELRKHSGPGAALEGMVLLTNSRLSVQPVKKEQWDFILDTLGAE